MSPLQGDGGLPQHVGKLLLSQAPFIRESEDNRGNQTNLCQSFSQAVPERAMWSSGGPEHALDVVRNNICSETTIPVP